VLSARLRRQKSHQGAVPRHFAYACGISKHIIAGSLQVVHVNREKLGDNGEILTFKGASSIRIACQGKISLCVLGMSIGILVGA
jgi:hypothetical protein